jgi:RNA methyltransferase, TrmH family
MIALRKLKRLRGGTRRRAIIRYLRETEATIARNAPLDVRYARGVAAVLAEDGELTPETRRWAEALQRALATFGEGGDAPALRRACNDARHALQRELGVPVADWDLQLPGAARLDANARTVLPIRLYLEDVRSPFNVGSVFRTAESFGVERILLSQGCASPRHPRAVRASMGCVDVIPWEIVPPAALDAVPGVFALETGGTPLSNFRFPLRGTAIVGSEELGVSPAALALAEAGAGRVSIPLYGAKASLNLSVACGVLLYQWFQAAHPRR